MSMVHLQFVVLHLLFICTATRTLEAKAFDKDDGPIHKVVDMLNEFLVDLQRESAEEQATYEEFACFCREHTEGGSRDARKITQAIKRRSSDIKYASMEMSELRIRLRKLETESEKLSDEKHQLDQRCRIEALQYQREIETSQEALDGTRNARESLNRAREFSKLNNDNTEFESFLEIRQKLLQTLSLADTVSKASAARQNVLNLLQAGKEPDDMTYDFHSNDIDDVLASMEKEFDAKAAELRDEARKHDAVCKEQKQINEDKRNQNKDKRRSTSQSLYQKEDSVASDKKDVVDDKSDLEDTSLYLSDLQMLCEQKAKAWDQRSVARGDEMHALKQALAFLQDGKAEDDKLTERGVNLRSSAASAAFVQSGSKPKPVSKVTNLEAGVRKTSELLAKSLSFFQDSSSKGRSSEFLARGELSLEAKKVRAISMLRKEGKRIGSLAITSLSVRASSDGFEKVKGLIQRLIERLLEESKGEATKKGFCDTEVAKAETERDHRWEESQALSAALERLEATEDKLTLEIKDLKRDIKVETQSLKEIQEERTADSAENQQTIETAKQGMYAVKEALAILRHAYKQLAKGSSFVQRSEKMTPGGHSRVKDKDYQENFGGMDDSSYHGNHGKSRAIFVLIEQIRDDFDRTVRITESAEKAAHREFVEFVQATKSSIAGKQTKQKLDEQDLKATEISIKSKIEDLQTASALTDAALKELEMLKPTCIDTGMSFKERSAKREDEIKALTDALCILGDKGLPAAKCVDGVPQ